MSSFGQDLDLIQMAKGVVSADNHLFSQLQAAQNLYGVALEESKLHFTFFGPIAFYDIHKELLTAGEIGSRGKYKLSLCRCR